MLFLIIESIFELLQHGFEKSVILSAHSLKHGFSPLKDSCLQSVQHYCKKVYQESTVDSVDDAKTCLNICVVCFQASIAPPFPICPLKECNCSMDTLFCFEKGAM